ncbi:17020_t:CDS:1, partial [Gigaspora margarita]
QFCQLSQSCQPSLSRQQSSTNDQDRSISPQTDPNETRGRSWKK